MRIRYNRTLKKQFFDVAYTSLYNTEKLNFNLHYLGHYLAGDEYCIEREDWDMLLLIYTISGEGYLKYNDIEYTLERNTAVLIDCNQKQLYKTGANDEWEFFYLHFTGAAASRYYELINENEVKKIGISNSNELIQLFYKLKLEAETESVKNHFRISSDIELMLTELLEQQDVENQENKKEAFSVEIEKIIAYMNEHYSEEVSLELLANKMVMSKYYFLRVFKEYVGITPHEYLTKTRMKEAKYLLTSTEYPLEYISVKIGYQNVNTFIKNFKREVRITPHQYRKRHL